MGGADGDEVFACGQTVKTWWVDGRWPTHFDRCISNNESGRGWLFLIDKTALELKICTTAPLLMQCTTTMCTITLTYHHLLDN